MLFPGLFLYSFSLSYGWFFFPSLLLFLVVLLLFYFYFGVVILFGVFAWFCDCFVIWVWCGGFFWSNNLYNCLESSALEQILLQQRRGWFRCSSQVSFQPLPFWIREGLFYQFFSQIFSTEIKPEVLLIVGKIKPQQTKPIKTTPPSLRMRICSRRHKQSQASS